MKLFSSIIMVLATGLVFRAEALTSRAQWLNSDTIVLNLHAGVYISPTSSHFFLVDDSAGTIREGQSLELPFLTATGNKVYLGTSFLSSEEIANWITKPLKVVLTNNDNQILDSTAVQFAGLLDQLFYYDGNDLGGSCGNSQCLIKLWAPTAQNVKVLLFANSLQGTPQAEVLEMKKSALGVWGLTLPTAYKNYFYLYEVKTFQPSTNKVETLQVTDPYSKSLSLNGEKSQLVDLSSVDLMPLGWSTLQKPYFRNLQDAVIYELHIRDFSATDDSLGSIFQGTYGAFSQDSVGVKYLKSLAQSGLTHLHLLPFSDFGSVDENKAGWDHYHNTRENLQEPQSIIGGIRGSDPFNWGYDPVHYLVPEGSYSVDPNGRSRILEVRQMVKAINSMGLRVVQDVVFNHTYRNGLEPFSIFDKIMPLYYYRLNPDGMAYDTSCCADTASEHRMMEKLMIDTVIHWAKTYKIDGFRFDLMSFHSIQTMSHIQQALKALTLAKDGVDGSKLLLYGEGWNYGSFYQNFPAQAMTMENSHGTGFGFFNDRLRDAARGGTTNAREKSDQGFVTGLYFDFNQEPANNNTPLDMQSQRDKLLHLGDVIKVGLAGNLRDFPFQDHLGNFITGHELYYREQPVAFASEALETVNYVSAHDGYTLWDSIQAKAPFYTPGRNPTTASSEDRQRMQQLALALPLLGQGIPFVEAGTELLRSKNGDQDSYDSGDFFNRLDFTGAQNFWGQGLPPAWKNLNDWSFWKPRLQEPHLQVQRDLISTTRKYFQALLKVRQGSDLFKLNSLKNITSHLDFIDRENGAEPGLIAMHLHKSGESLLVLFNASRESRVFVNPLLQQSWHLHPDLDGRVDAVLNQVVLMPNQSSVQIPGRTTLVLVRSRK